MRIDLFKQIKTIEQHFTQSKSFQSSSIFMYVTSEWFVCSFCHVSCFVFLVEFVCLRERVCVCAYSNFVHLILNDCSERRSQLTILFFFDGTCMRHTISACTKDHLHIVLIFVLPVPNEPRRLRAILALVCVRSPNHCQNASRIEFTALNMPVCRSMFSALFSSSFLHP